MLTLMLNATTCASVVKYLGLTRKDDTYKATMKQFKRKVHVGVVQEFNRLQPEQRFKLADFQKVKEILGLEDEGVFAEAQHPPQGLAKLGSCLFTENTGTETKESTDTSANKTTIIDAEIPEELVISTRKMFYKMVNHAYWQMIDDDLLPSESRACTVLLESLDSSSAIEIHPINDFEGVLKHIRCGHGSHWFLAKIVRIWRDFLNGTGIGHDIVPITRGDIKFDVYALLCCMDAHIMAEKVLRTLHFTKEDDLSRAHQKVIKESAEQTEKIKAFLRLNHVDEGAVGLCRTKMMILFLLKKKKAMIKSWVSSGLLCEADMEILLEDTEHEAGKVKELHLQHLVSTGTLELGEIEIKKSPTSSRLGSQRLLAYRPHKRATS